MFTLSSALIIITIIIVNAKNKKDDTVIIDISLMLFAMVADLILAFIIF